MTPRGNNFQWKVYSCENRKTWFDPHQRGWTLQTVDANGDQIGDCEYSFLHTKGNQKQAAATWLYGKPSKGFKK